MQKLNVRFTEETKQAVSRLSQSVGRSDSSVARAALNIGLTILIVESQKEVSKVDSMISTCQKAGF